MKAPSAIFDRAPGLLLVILAISYALIAGLRTVSDFDLGWQLATGRYMVEHRKVPETDVLSYTAKGREWIYPPFSGLVFYAAHQAGGFAALSWVGAAACVAAVTVLLAGGGPITAALAILAAPFVAFRTAPVSDLFTTLLFTIALVLLWQHRVRAGMPLWLLPLLMTAWANLHLGFIAGLALFVAYTTIELMDCVVADRRPAALARLRRAAPWMAAASAATLLNPWGPRIYLAIARQSNVMEAFGDFVGYWSKVPLSLEGLAGSFSWRDPESGHWWLMAAALAAMVWSLWRKQPAMALFLAGATVVSLRYFRFQGLFAVVTVAVAGPFFDERIAGFSRDRRRVARTVTWSLAAMMLWLVGVRASDLVSDRHYVWAGEVSTFGPGVSWWYPQRAAGFLLRERLPGRLFNDYNVGGYLTWSLAPHYEVFLDGRAVPFGADLFFAHRALMQQPPDSAEWRVQADRWGFNTLVFSVARYGGLGSIPLRQFCESAQWRPVYLDEVSVIFVRNVPQNASWIDRLTIDCATVQFIPPVRISRAELFNYYANAGSVLYMLSRDAESLDYLDRGRKLFPNDPNLYLARGQIFQANGRLADAALEYETSIRIKPADAAWYALGRVQAEQRRYAEAAESISRAAARSVHAHDRYRALGQVYLAMGRPQDALTAFDRALARSPFRGVSEKSGADFLAQVATGRSRAWRALGDLPKATQFLESAVRYLPGDTTHWLELAELYQAQGRNEAAEEARKQAGGPPRP